MTKKSDTHLKLIEQAVNKIQAGNFPEAEEILAQILSENPNSEEAMFAMAMCRHGSGNKLSALSYLADLLTLNSKNAAACYLAGLILMEDNDYKNAGYLLKTALEKDPGFTDARRAYAQLLLLTKQDNEGLAILKDLLSADPEDYQSLMMLSQYYQNIGKYDIAEFYLIKVQLINPDYQPVLAATQQISRS